MLAPLLPSVLLPLSKVVDWDRVTKNEMMGRLELSRGENNKHWQEIQDKPRRQIAQWHRLCA